MNTKKITELLKNREFLNVATCDFNARPNVAPKFLLKVEDNFIYLIDYIIGATFNNLKINPRVSLSFMDRDNLKSYQINGSVEIIEKGALYDKILNEFRQKKITLATERVIEGVQRGQRHEASEAEFSENIAVFRVSVQEIVEIYPSGVLKREAFGPQTKG